MKIWGRRNLLPIKYSKIERINFIAWMIFEGSKFVSFMFNINLKEKTRNNLNIKI